MKSASLNICSRKEKDIYSQKDKNFCNEPQVPVMVCRCILREEDKEQKQRTIDTEEGEK